MVWWLTLTNSDLNTSPAILTLRFTSSCNGITRCHMIQWLNYTDLYDIYYQCNLYGINTCWASHTAHHSHMEGSTMLYAITMVTNNIIVIQLYLLHNVYHGNHGDTHIVDCHNNLHTVRCSHTVTDHMISL